MPDIFDISTPRPTFIAAIGHGDFRGPDGRRHPRQAVDRWQENDWARAAGTWRPFVLVRATPPGGERITAVDHVFDNSIWPHERREVITATEPLPPIEVFVPLATIRERVEALGQRKADDVATAIDALSPFLRWKLSSLREGIAPDDPQARGLLAAAGLTPTEIDQVLSP